MGHPQGQEEERERRTLCAVREISEETGLAPDLLRIRGPLCQSSYISYYSGKPFNKTVEWFLLDYRGKLSDPLIPDLSEDIDLCWWAPVDDLLKVLETARPYLRSVRRSIEESFHLLEAATAETSIGIAAS